eukprot:5992-Eustigmatos_ZCMA.PRE.1
MSDVCRIGVSTLRTALQLVDASLAVELQVDASGLATATVIASTAQLLMPYTNDAVVAAFGAR